MSPEATVTARLAQLDPQPTLTLSPRDEQARDALLTHLVTSDPARDLVAHHRLAHRRHPRRARRAVFAGLSVAAAAGAACILVVSATAQAPHADYALGGPVSLASWTQSPSHATATQAAIDACASALYGAGTDSSGLAVSAPETRGDFTAFQLLGSATAGYCVLLGDRILVAEQILATSSAPPAAGHAEVNMIGIAVNSFDGPDAAAQTAEAGNIMVAAGHAGPDITSITVHLMNGKDVVASVADGVWSAWWPSAFEQDGAESTVTENALPSATFSTADGGTGVVSMSTPSLESLGYTVDESGRIISGPPSTPAP